MHSLESSCPDSLAKEKTLSVDPSTVGNDGQINGQVVVATELEAPKKARKKTVTFKNVLETSDDIVVKKVYNPSGTPLVPIIKKDSSIRSMEPIVKPSRLTDIVKQSRFNNLNHIKTLGFVATDDRDEDEEESQVTGHSLLETDESVADNEVDEESASSNVAVGDKRFILPKRSLHSRRVIKPNKKFLDDMDGCSAKALKRVNSGSKVKATAKTEAAETNIIDRATLPSGKGVKGASKDVLVEATVKNESDLATKEVTNLFGMPVSSVGSNLNLTPFGSNKVILRQPRLQFAMPISTTTTPGTQASNNIFGFNSSTNGADNNGLTGSTPSQTTNVDTKAMNVNGRYIWDLNS